MIGKRLKVISLLFFRMVSTPKKITLWKVVKVWDMKVMGFEDPWSAMEECDNTMSKRGSKKP